MLPGVTVTATSPSMLGAQTTVTSETGNYRFPAVPPGTYTVTYELTGFNSRQARRHSDRARLHGEHERRARARHVARDGDGHGRIARHRHVRDACSCRTSSSSSCSRLPNARDMWSLLAVTPGVQMARIDVGGNRAGTQTDYTRLRLQRPGARAHRRHQHDGRHRRRRLLFRLLVARRSVPRHDRASRPRCRTPACSRSSSPSRAATSSTASTIVDWYNNSLQGSNIPDEYTSPTAFNGTNGSNAIRAAQQRDRALLRPRHQRRRSDQAGQDLVVRHLPQAVQRSRAAELPVRQDVQHQAVEPGRQGHLPG